jgi:hypothetical protein
MPGAISFVASLKVVTCAVVVPRVSALAMERAAVSRTRREREFIGG